MARYTYECRKCGKRFEVSQRMTDPKIKFHNEFKDLPYNETSECDGELDRLIECPSVIFKGKGWTPNFANQKQNYKKLNQKLDDMGIQEQK